MERTLHFLLVAKRTARFQRPQDHELYKTGHLLSAAVVHHRLTGKNNLLPVAVGHNVFFTYRYTGAGDQLAETVDARLAGAFDRLWADLTQRRMFVHGGVSAIPVGLSNKGILFVCLVCSVVTSDCMDAAKGLCSGLVAWGVITHR